MNENLKIKELNIKILQAHIKTAAIILFVLFELALIAFLLDKYKVIKLSNPEQQIGIINFNKVITTESLNETINIIDEALKNKKVKSILFIMNSPGGSPSSSEELSEYLKEASKIKPITMYVESIAASGGYYVASSLKPLIVNKNAIIGSIGVILQHYNIEELANTIGVKEDNLTYGEFKQPLSSFKEIDEKSKEYLTNHLLKPMYDNFINSIAVNRNVSKELIEELAQGKVFLGNDERIKNILVDRVSNLFSVKKEIQKEFPEAEFVVLDTKKTIIEELLNANFNINLGINQGEIK